MKRAKIPWVVLALLMWVALDGGRTGTISCLIIEC